MISLNPIDWLRRATEAPLEPAQPTTPQARRLDGWANEYTGFGTSIDKTTYSYFQAYQPLGDQTLSNLYHHNDTAQRIVDVVPQEQYRKGFTVSVGGNPELSAEIGDKLRQLDARGHFMRAARWGRLYGGCALILGADDGGKARRPLNPDAVRDVEWFRVADKRELHPLSYYETGAKAGQPETYTYTPIGLHGETSSVIHESRLIVFGGAPTGHRERLENGGWDFSVLQAVYEIIRSYDTGWRAVETLLADGQQPVFKTPGLGDAILANGESAVQSRWRLLNQSRSVTRALVLDAGNSSSGIPPEEFERQSVSFADIPATLDKWMLRLASAVQIPVTILMGQSPAGMSATGESDFRWFYDRIESSQEVEVAPKVRRLVEVLLRSKSGPGAWSDDIEIKVEFPSLWSETPSAQATTRKTLADADAVYVNAGVLTPEEVAISRFGGDGFDNEIELSEDSLEARRSVLEVELELAEDEAKNPPQAPPAFAGPPSGDAERFAADPDSDTGPGAESESESESSPEGEDDGENDD